MYATANNAHLLIDSHGVGDPILDELHRENISVEGYNIKTNALKLDLIDNLSVMVDNQAFTVPGSPVEYDQDKKKIRNAVCVIPELYNEMGLFGYKISAAGIKTYSAPEGYHDDTVIALA